ncbi:MAG: TrmH family RNA methyltransferase [Lachnospiraceae bacterium]|nr:TrmH family RNA methyltransferase [Lachnospiraceae bacterium]
MEPIKPYKGKCDYSYTLGAFPTYELINNKPEWVREVYIHSSFTDSEKLKRLCAEKRIGVFVNDKLISRLSDKENVYVIGVYNKASLPLDENKSHIMLVNPGNMGNVGTIIRTAIAFGIHNLAIISPGVDIHNPKVVRGSMGALFHMNIEYFESFSEYEKKYCGNGRECFSFMLTAKEQLNVNNCPKPELFTLIFGNEATGLPEEYADFTNPIIIPQSDEVDSLNLTIAAGIGMYMFTNRN